ncbi:hypothetical protein [Nocardia salmonicida]|uniref:hypothetical protein n=1 Tax=Nocardia salmonicida TaxID=53431 RepID=UPI002E28C83E|nr:hypothetical protein [Nocardia salmonicida]
MDEWGVLGVAGCVVDGGVLGGVRPVDNPGWFGVVGWAADGWAVGVAGLVVVDCWGMFDVGDWLAPGVIGALMGGVDGVELGGVVVVGVAVGVVLGAVAVVAALVVVGSVCCGWRVVSPGD